MPKDTLSVTDNRTGKTYEIPIENGCIRAPDAPGRSRPAPTTSV